MASKKNFYAVRKGRNIGIYKTWAECQKQVTGFKDAEFKGFITLAEAEVFMNGNNAMREPLDETVDNSKFKSVKKNTFTEKPDIYYAYVDGSYALGRYSWGMVIYCNGQEVQRANGIGASAEDAALHNVAGEIQGAMEAAKWAYANDQQIVICHDYTGVAAWALGEWKTNKELTKRYAMFMKDYLPLLSFQKVAGHTGVVGNELADKLAKEALGI